jgi:hypothetical protein
LQTVTPRPMSVVDIPFTVPVFGQHAIFVSWGEREDASTPIMVRVELDGTTSPPAKKETEGDRLMKFLFTSEHDR